MIACRAIFKEEILGWLWHPFRGDTAFTPKTPPGAARGRREGQGGRAAGRGQLAASEAEWNGAERRWLLDVSGRKSVSASPDPQKPFHRQDATGGRQGRQGLISRAISQEHPWCGGVGQHLCLLSPVNLGALGALAV